VKSTHNLPLTLYFVFWSNLIIESKSESSSSDEIEEVNDKFHVQMGKHKNSRISLANRKELENELLEEKRREKKMSMWPANRFRIPEENVKENQKNL
jgi:hypothetical protein